MKADLIYLYKNFDNFIRRIKAYFFANKRKKVYIALADEINDVRLNPMLQFLLLNKLAFQDKEKIATIERLRSSLYKDGNPLIPVYYSPKPGSSGSVDHPSNTLSHGEIIYFSAKWIAKVTSKNSYWATVLYLCAEHSKAKQILELGSCAGISGAYMLSSSAVEHLFTIEASQNLAKIAQCTLDKIKKGGLVINSFFSKGMQFLFKENNLKFDLVYIDGHHEKVATLKYYEMIKPYLNSTALVIFDDIYWSKDMSEAWEIIKNMPGFKICIDIGMFGLCVWDNATLLPKYVSLSEYTYGLKKWKHGKPHGWK